MNISLWETYFDGVTVFDGCMQLLAPRARNWGKLVTIKGVNIMNNIDLYWFRCG
jgi:hypothetical protein